MLLIIFEKSIKLKKQEMKKLFSNPMSLVILLFAITIAGSNISCNGRASNNDKNTSVSETSSNAVITLTDQTFDSKINTGVTLVDFWATWCKPCRAQGPVIEEIGKDMAGKVTVGKLDIDENPSIVSRFGIENIPTMIIFKNGKVVQQFIGLTAKEDIVSALNKQLK